MTNEQENDPPPTPSPPFNETVRLAKYIVSLFSSSSDPTAGDQSFTGSSSIFNNSHDEHLYNLLNNPKLKKDEAIIHVYILFVLLCYVIGTGLIVVKYIKRDSTAFTNFNGFPSRTISFTHMDSSEVWIKSTETSCASVTESYSEDEDDDSLLSPASERLHLYPASQVTYV